MAIEGLAGRAKLALLTVGLLLVAGCSDEGTGPDGTCARNASGATTLSLGQTVQGSLQDSDCEDPEDGANMDVYRFTLSQATTVGVSMSSTALNSYLYLLSENGTVVAENNNLGSGTTDAGIVFDLQAGTYFVNATSAMAGETGDYTLTLQRVCTENDVGGDVPLPGTVNGSLTQTDCVLQDGSSADIYRLVNSTSRQVTIDMTSTAFDTYLVLLDGNFQPVAENDDISDSNLNSRITLTLPAGTFYVIANSARAGESGNYTLSTSTP